MKVSQLRMISYEAQFNRDCDIYCSCNCGKRLPKEEVYARQMKHYHDPDHDIKEFIDALYDIDDILIEAEKYGEKRRFMQFSLEIDKPFNFTK